MRSALSAVLFSSANVTAMDLATPPNTINIVNPSWKNFTEVDGTGFYFDLMRTVYEPEGITVNIEIMPWARAELMLVQLKADAMLGAYQEEVRQFTYPDKPLWLDTSSVVFKPSKQKWHGIESMQGKSIGWIRGYDYHKFIDPIMDYVEVLDNHQGWQMLAKDRLDFYMDSSTDLQLYMAEHSLNADEYQIKSVLVKRLFLRLARTKKGRQLAGLYDQRIMDLYRSGKLRDLYLKWGYSSHYQAFEHVLTQP